MRPGLLVAFGGKPVKGTQLWQEAGSPIIHGRSRRMRPFWQAWWVSAVGAVAVLAGAEWWIRAGSSGVGVQAVRAVAVLGVSGAAVGSASGVWLARAAGWRWAWVYGLACGVALGLLSVWLLGGLVKV